MKLKIYSVLAGILSAVSVFAADEPDGKYTFAFSGSYSNLQEIVPTGTVCKVTLENAHFTGGFKLPDGVTVIFKPKSGTTNTFSKVTGAKKSKMEINGKGTISLTGTDTLLDIPYLNVNEGTLLIKSTGVSATKTPVADINWNIKQEGGVIDLDIDVPGTNQVYGFRVGKNKAGKANFEAGEFRAKIGGWKSAAVYADSLATEVVFKKKLTIDAQLNGPEARFANVKCDLTLKNCQYDISMPDSYTSITNARVFKSDKSIVIDGGTYNISAPGPGSEIFSAADTIIVSNGTFNVFADDDCFSAMTNIVVEGGNIYAASNDDVFDSNGTMTINGGTILAYATAEGHEGFDVDPEETASGASSNVLVINGGTIFATGGNKSSWPAILRTGAGVTLYKKNATDGTLKSTYSGKFVSMQRSDGFVPTAKLPTFGSGSYCSVLFTCPGLTTPTIPAATPSEFNRVFGEYFETTTLVTNQEGLRLCEIYGSTCLGSDADGTFGDVGEYVVLTNTQNKTVNLRGLRLSVSKAGDAPSLSIVLPDGGTLAPFGTLTLDQASFDSKLWVKITNGEIVFALADIVGTPIQDGTASFNLYPSADGGGASLLATSFGAVLSFEDWVPSFYPPELGPDPKTGLPPFSVSDNLVTLRVANATAGLKYGYKKASTLADLASVADSEIVWLPTPAAADGVLEISIDRLSGEAAGFYKLVVAKP